MSSTSSEYESNSDGRYSIPSTSSVYTSYMDPKALFLSGQSSVTNGNQRCCDKMYAALRNACKEINSQHEQLCVTRDELQRTRKALKRAEKDCKEKSSLIAYLKIENIKCVKHLETGRKFSENIGEQLCSTHIGCRQTRHNATHPIETINQASQDLQNQDKSLIQNPIDTQDDLAIIATRTAAINNVEQTPRGKLHESNPILRNEKSELNVSAGNMKEMGNELEKQQRSPNGLQNKGEQVKREKKLDPSKVKSDDAIRRSKEQWQWTSNNQRSRRPGKYPDLETLSDEETTEELEQRIQESPKARRERLREYWDSEDRVYIMARIKPGADNKLFSTTNSLLHIHLPPFLDPGDENQAKRSFSIGTTFTPEHDDHDIWEKICPLFQSAKLGSQVTVLFYGRSGTGKSYNVDNLLRRIGDLIFQTLKTDASMSYTEIYNGVAKDLLSGRAKVETRKTSPKTNPPTVRISTHEQFEKYLHTATKSRRTASTAVNDISSRSHAIIQIDIGKGCFSIVDLAGQERIDGEDSGTKLQETKDINSTLNGLAIAVQKWVKNPDTPAIWRENILCKMVGSVIDSTDHWDDTNVRARRLIVFKTLNLENEKEAKLSLATLEFIQKSTA
ncbi:P-loop containing nucleoside triphosphate hydrolase protein [Daldinia eschscholtzii]|nr:P-loop containing nucleoside triphosphate hydrolase protein [Daldinia eschscholtzii]